MTEQQRQAALEWIERRYAAHALNPYDRRGEGYPEIFEILKTIRSALQAPQPEEVTVHKFMEGCSHILSLQSGQLMGRFIRQYYPNGLRIVKEKNDDSV